VIGLGALIAGVPNDRRIDPGDDLAVVAEVLLQRGHPGCFGVRRPVHSRFDAEMVEQHDQVRHFDAAIAACVARVV